MPKPQKHPRFLLVSRIGPDSLHAHWIDGAAQGWFDVLLSCYAPVAGLGAGRGVTTEHRPGRKVAGYSGILRDHAARLAQYDYVCFMDEDLQISAERIAGCFDLAATYQIKIAQPAYAWGSHFSYAATLRQPQFRLRFVNFVEMGCPIFRKDVLAAIAPLYHSGLESGIDLIWCNAVAESPRDFAVIDAFPALHTQPVGGKADENGFADVHGYEAHILAALARYGVPRHRMAAYEGLRHDGRVVRGRLQLALAALSVFGALPKQPKMRTLVKCGFDMLWHQIFLGARNSKVTLERGQA